MVGDIPVSDFLQYALVPMVLLQIMIVAFYIIHAIRIWPGMPRREAVLYAPLAVPFGFLAFFVLLNLLASKRPLTDFAGPLALVVLLPWLAGIATGAITYARMKRRQD